MPGTVYYFCYAHNRPTGGQKHTYAHVEILNRRGFRAFAVHPADNYRLTWFPNNTPTMSLDEYLRLRADDDYIVLPEDLGTRISEFPGRKVIFNKGLYRGYLALGAQVPPMYPYDREDVVAAMVVSEHNRAHLQFACPRLKVFRVITMIDTERFQHVPIAQKEKLIVYPQKAAPSLLCLYHMLQSRARAGLNELRGFEWALLDGMDEGQVIATLKRALVLVFLNHEEGLPRTVLEAMACGAIAVGFNNGPLQECLLPSVSVGAGDLVSLARIIESIAADFVDFPDRLRKLSDEGLAQCLKFDTARAERTVVAAWEDIMGMEPATCR